MTACLSQPLKVAQGQEVCRDCLHNRRTHLQSSTQHCSIGISLRAALEEAEHQLNTSIVQS